MENQDDATMSDWLSSIKRRFEEDMSSEDAINTVAEEITDILTEEAILETIFEIHKTEKLNSSDYLISEEDVKTYSIVESNDGFIIGQQFVKKCLICRCPRCQRRLSPAIFTGHLQSCVGKGRSSARIASLRIANNCVRNVYGGMSDEDDDDWIAGPEKAKKKKLIEAKKGQDKNNIKRGKSQNKKKSNPKDVVFTEDISTEEI